MGEYLSLFWMRERSTRVLPAGVNSLSLVASEPWALSTIALETSTTSPVSDSAMPPTHSPARDMCSKPSPSGNSNEGFLLAKLVPKNP